MVCCVWLMVMLLCATWFVIFNRNHIWAFALCFMLRTVSEHDSTCTGRSDNHTYNAICLSHIVRVHRTCVSDVRCVYIQVYKRALVPFETRMYFFFSFRLWFVHLYLRQIRKSYVILCVYHMSHTLSNSNICFFAFSKKNHNISWWRNGPPLYLNSFEPSTYGQWANSFFFLLEAYTCETFLFLYIYRDPTNTISEILHRNSRSEVNNMDAAKKPIDVVDTKPFVEYVSSINIIYSNFGTLSGFVHFRFS